MDAFTVVFGGRRGVERHVADSAAEQPQSPAENRITAALYAGDLFNAPSPQRPQDAEVLVASASRSHGIAATLLYQASDEPGFMTFELRWATTGRPLGWLFAGQSTTRSPWWFQVYFDGQLLR